MKDNERLLTSIKINQVQGGGFVKKYFITKIEKKKREEISIKVSKTDVYS